MISLHLSSVFKNRLCQVKITFLRMFTIYNTPQNQLPVFYLVTSCNKTNGKNQISASPKTLKIRIMPINSKTKFMSKVENSRSRRRKRKVRVDVVKKQIPVRREVKRKNVPHLKQIRAKRNLKEKEKRNSKGCRRLRQE